MVITFVAVAVAAIGIAVALGWQISLSFQGSFLHFALFLLCFVGTIFGSLLYKLKVSTLSCIQ